MPHAPLLQRIQNRLFPSERLKALKRWYADEGDYRLRQDYNLGQDSFVLDFGGYQGQWASDLYSRYCCPIAVFEPVPQFAEKIQRRFARNERIEVLPFGLGGSTRTERIHLSADGSSVFGHSANVVDVRIRDANDWLVERGEPEVSLAKINIEGGEYELLDRLIETGQVARFRDIQVQFHELDTSSATKMERLQSLLRNTHELTYQYRFVWENWTRKNS